MPKLPISILILTKNSQQFIKTALISASFADEIIILDDGSTDNTLAIASRYTNKIIKYQKNDNDFSLKRNLLKDQASHPWLFYLDADERISQQLKNEIEKVVNANKPGVYQINRLNIFWGKPFFYGGWSPSWVIRFFHKDCLIKWQGQLHEQPAYKGQLQSLSQPLIHLSHSDLKKSLENTLAWSWIEAGLFVKANHRPVKWYHFFSAPLKEFIFRFIKRQGYRDGLEGLLDSIMQAISKFITYERLWELQNGKLETKYNLIDQKLKTNNFDFNSIKHK
ncbi:MAG: glycosyltransferase family 2 protein [bacterium]|nr:glycosyltransferase family 2 protein [bacterium]